MLNAKEIGERIKNLRLQANLTQEELAQKLNYKSRSTINKIELGINEIHPTKVFAFAYALNSTPEYILGWTNKNEKANYLTLQLVSGEIIKKTLSNESVAKVLKVLEDK